MPDPITTALPMQTRAAPLPASVDPEARTFEVVFSTGAPVRRREYRGWDGPAIAFDEVLEISTSAIDMTRLAGRAPLLDNHNRWSMDDQLGVVEEAWVEQGKGAMARVRMHPAGVSPRADMAFAMVQAGTMPSISVGYSIDKVRVVAATAETVEQRIVERWTPMEISLVSVPADAGATTRASGDERAATFPVIVTRATAHNEEGHMPQTENTVAENPATAHSQTNEAPISETRAAPAGLTAAEALDIAAVAEPFGLRTEAETMVRSGTMTGEAIRSEILRRAAARQAPNGSIGGPRAIVLTDEAETARRGMEGAALARLLGRAPADDNERRYMAYGFADFGAELSGARSLPRGGDREEFARRSFMNTGDRPSLFGNVFNRAILARYEAQTPTYRMIFGKRNLPDKRTANLVRAGDFPKLKQVTQSGEIQAGTIGESAEAMRLVTFASQLRVTRDIILNDDLGAIAQIITEIGTMAADFESNTAYGLMLSASGAGPTLASDSTAVFHANHGNLMTGAVIDATSVGLARAAMRKQMSIGSGTAAADRIMLNIAPQYLLCGPDRELQAEQLLAPITAATVANAVPESMRRLQVMADANIPGNAWYLFADPARYPTFMYGYLEGAEGIQVREQTIQGALAYAWDAFLDFGVAAVDYRGAVRNPGA
jgi:hypothetical protein